MGIKINVQLKGFDRMLEKIQEAEGNIHESAMKASEAGIQAMHDALKDAVLSSPVSVDTQVKMLESLRPPVTINYGNLYWSSVGFKMGAYDPKNPSGGYIAVFNEFGTKQRKTKEGQGTGKIPAMNTIIPAIKQARPAIRKAQQKVLDDVLNTLGG